MASSTAFHFQTFDTNSVGRIGVSEIGSLLGALGEPMTDDESKEAIAMLDRDGLGTVTFEKYSLFPVVHRYFPLHLSLSPLSLLSLSNHERIALLLLLSLPLLDQSCSFFSVCASFLSCLFDSMGVCVCRFVLWWYELHSLSRGKSAKYTARFKMLSAKLQSSEFELARVVRQPTGQEGTPQFRVNYYYKVKKRL